MIKVAFTKNGPIIGDFNESDIGWTIENPCAIMPNGALIPLTMITETNTLELSRTELQFQGVHDPVGELRNMYSSQFGSGIQLLGA